MDERDEIYKSSLEIIKTIYGQDASFRQGQYEAIEATMTRKRTLVVQKTGWGKSLVYFVCTKLLRAQGRGVTLVVSPLLSLMRNQLEAGQRLGLRCEMLNSRVKDRKEEILDLMERGETDLVLITPETLFSGDVQKRLENIEIGLLVIDEAHCISDWGHDFRLEYGSLRRIISALPPSVPILATTATANDRVIEDLEKQLGDNTYVSRGELMRDNLYIQVMHMPSRSERYAWLIQSIGKLKGSGIVYCLTQRDCDYLSDFLSKNGISAVAYYSRDTSDGELINEDIEERFKRNEIKVLVATVKLGMGYDKGDISFIVHFQMPSCIVSYYQQIGRAGRSIDKAYTFLMCGKEDETILSYFIRTAFPTESEANSVMELIENGEGLRLRDIESKVNMRRARLNRTLDFLQHDGYVVKEKYRYYKTDKKYIYEKEHYDGVTARRIREMEQMRAMTRYEGCYGKFIVNSLDDKTERSCGVCANCLGRELLSSQVSQEYLDIATEYLKGISLEIEPRRMWVESSLTEAKKISLPNERGICLCRYGEAGYGELVKRAKETGDTSFSQELVGKSRELLQSLVYDGSVTHITSVPSQSAPWVESFAKEMSKALGIPYVPLLKKKRARPQREMENSAFQCANAYESYSLLDGVSVPKRILLIDGLVNSRWTLTVCGYRLREAGCEAVYPFALADTSQGDE
ncbi:MAG: RecQ family ATP-dependent DNA helicase [Clostridia bacterium]|nr:RecQ family ATP-dependent DNA helicase [Clostridia bacterium]